MLHPDNEFISDGSSQMTLPMTILGADNYYDITGMYMDNIVYFRYIPGTLQAICRRLTLATET
jgi:hypothetical protein